MLYNTSLRTKIANLQKEHSELSKEKAIIAQDLKTTGLSNKAYNKAKRGLIQTIPQELFEKHDSLAQRYHIIESRILEINAKLAPLHVQDGQIYGQAVKDILKEIFTKDQLIEIYEEARKRLDGEEPTRVLINFEAASKAVDDSFQYKKLYLKSLEEIQEIRILLTRIIENGCAHFGDAEFMKLISPLNRLVIPLNEINKKKFAVTKANHFIKT